VIADHCVTAGLLHGEQHRIVGPKGSPKLGTADDQQQQDRHSDAGFDPRRTFFGAAPRRPTVHCRRNSVVAVKVAGIPGHGTNGVKAWLALILMKMRLGSGRPNVAHDSVQAIDVASAHSQLNGKLAGKVSAGAKLMDLCIAFWIPGVSAGKSLAYCAPIRVAPLQRGRFCCQRAEIGDSHSD
jgi:hypothetical protein